MVVSTFEPSAVMREEILGHVSKLLSVQSAEVTSQHDMTSGTYELHVKVPVNRTSQSAVNALTSLGVDAALDRARK